MLKNAKNRGSFLPSPVPPLNKGTGEGPKIMEHSAERSAEQGMFGLWLALRHIHRYVRWYGMSTYVAENFSMKALKSHRILLANKNKFCQNLIA